MSNRTRGFTLIELLVVVLVVALLIGLLLPALSKATRSARTMKDGSQQKEIHQGFLIFAQGHKGLLPRPGLIDRLPDPVLGDVPESGEEDYSANHSASLYSACIMQQHSVPEMLVGPTEDRLRGGSPVQVKSDYNHEAYAPLEDVYWDKTFSADVEARTSNASFTHLALCGARLARHWTDTLSSTQPVLATRATREGIESGDEYDLSPTLELHGSTSQWIGNVVYADGHVEQMVGTFYPELVTYRPEGRQSVAPVSDNIFAAEFDDVEPDGRASADTWLVLSTKASADGLSVTPVYDALIDF